MKRESSYLFIILFAILSSFTSCKKEDPCEGCINGNKPPSAVAGADKIISLPTDSVLLDGNASTDPDGSIVGWLWTKISGPSSCNFVNRAAAKTVVRDLAVGDYLFELKVTDERGLFSTDTIAVAINPSSDFTRWKKLSTLNEAAGETIILGIETDLVFIGESRSKKFWKYDRLSNSYIQMPDMPSQAVCCSMESFTVNGNGYVGMGLGSGQIFDSDEMYQFEPGKSQWRRINNSPIAGFATSFVINGFVYLLQGKSVWSYDPNNDSYVQKNDFPGNPSRILTSGFVINGEGYFVSGSSCWKYLPAIDTWYQMADLPSHLQLQASFSLNNYGYVLADSAYASWNNHVRLQLWKYDALQNHWRRLQDDYPGEGTSQVKTALVNGVVYVGFGYKNINNADPTDDLAGDFWKFQE